MLLTVLTCVSALYLWYLCMDLHVMVLMHVPVPVMLLRVLMHVPVCYGSDTCTCILLTVLTHVTCRLLAVLTHVPVGYLLAWICKVLSFQV